MKRFRRVEGSWSYEEYGIYQDALGRKIVVMPVSVTELCGDFKRPGLYGFRDFEWGENPLDTWAYEMFKLPNPKPEDWNLVGSVLDLKEAKFKHDHTDWKQLRITSRKDRINLRKKRKIIK